MNDPEPKHDVTPSAEKLPASSVPPGLVFKPDVRQSVLVARVRAFTLAAAAVLMVVAFILIVTYRPPPMARPDQEAPKGTSPPIESVSPAVPQAPGQFVAAPRKASGADIARSAVAALDTLVSAAAEKWLRAAEFLPQGTVTSDNAQDAAEKLRKAVILADSARQVISLGRQQAELVREASRETESNAGFRLSVLYSNMDRYLKSVGDDATDRRDYYARSLASVEAMLLNDPAESEIQHNVAMSYLRHSEDRQPKIRQLAEQVHEAQRNIDNAGR